MFESTRIAEEWLLYSYDVVGMKVECSDNRRLGYAVPLQRERGRVLAGDSCASLLIAARMRQSSPQNFSRCVDVWESSRKTAVKFEVVAELKSCRRTAVCRPSYRSKAKALAVYCSMYCTK